MRDVHAHLAASFSIIGFGILTGLNVGVLTQAIFTVADTSGTPLRQTVCASSMTLPCMALTATVTSSASLNCAAAASTPAVRRWLPVLPGVGEARLAARPRRTPGDARSG